MRAALVAGALALGLTVTACGGGSDEAGGADTRRTPKHGGTLTYLVVSDAVSLDPFTDFSVVRLAALYDPLVYLDPGTGKLVPHLAESLTSADNGATWTMRLRPGVRFSDGTALDASAVKLNWDMHARPESRSIRRGAAAGLRTEVVDPLTLRITPPAPNANFDRTAVEIAYMAAPSVLTKGPEVYRNQPVGAGPFVLKSWSRGSRIEFAKNPAYWQADKGLPYLDALTVKVMPDAEQQFNTLKSGGADMFISYNTGQLARAKKELNMASVASSGGQAVQFNLARPPFDDARARRAFALALDPAEMARTLRNQSRPAKGVFARSSPFYAAEAAQPAPDREEAQRLFDELAAQGRKVDFSFLVPQTPDGLRAAEYLQSRLLTFRNVAVRIEPIEVGAFTIRYGVNRDFQATLKGDWLVDPEPTMFNAFHSASAQNVNGWKNADADRALAAGRASTDPETRRRAYTDLQRALAADLPLWVFAESEQGQIFTNRVTGVRLYNNGTVLLDRVGFAP